MRKAMFFTALVISSLTAKAQESKAKLKMHAADLGPGIFYIDLPGTSDAGGLSFTANVSVACGKNLIAAGYLGGADLAILGNSEYKFDEFSLSYGRDWTVNDWLGFEGFVGVGYYHQQTDYADLDISNLEDGSVVSFPLKINTKFYLAKNFGLGINANYSVNSINNNLSGHILCHYKFN